jgi:CHAT domain-containing protein
MSSDNICCLDYETQITQSAFNRAESAVAAWIRIDLTCGSRSVVSSLWKVDDAATSLLMEEFYQNLWQRRLPKAEALRRAQLTVLKAPGQISERSRELALRGVRGLETGRTRVLESRATDPDRSHPALWAAFVLNGDAR